MPRQRLRNFARDPLCHFALLGGLLFGLNSLFQNDTPDTDEIVVSENRIEHIANIFQRGWQRPPDASELRGLVDDFVREEVLYREAVRLGLDQDDTVIRRRLRMKMEYLAKDLVNAIEPGDPVLEAYYQKNLAQYARPARYSFEQIYFNSDRRPEVAEDARLVLAKLASGDDPRELGDSNLLQHSYQDISAERIDRLFGSSFVLQLAELEPGQWQGPVTSAYGEHLVRISAQQPASTAPFASVRDEVLRDWQLAEQKRILETQYQTLRKNYRVTIADIAGIELGPAAQAPASGGEVARQ
ncbi:peptidylprolyl isomerase [uncultured Microbulbifer sp.]|uniref:peptidylprolyl isomerase n=1 Tax=uncultured Microbulbifer sp. TaxID=348147 RepID=UPI0025ED565E|nr:peptidylprolyl isomerase [uncultured Microbulbifer sp.]